MTSPDGAGRFGAGRFGALPADSRAALKHRARQFNRLRWVRKARVVAAGEGNATRWQALRYVLADPELDTFSYDVANGPEIAAILAPVLGLDAGGITALFDEALRDTVLAARIRGAARGDWAVKSRPGLGRHLVGYAAVRALDPPAVLEVGVRFGLGSLVLLRALERNAAADGLPAGRTGGRPGGKPGELVSADLDAFAGSLVAAGTPGWRFVVGGSPAVLPEAIGGRRIGFAVLDSTPDPEVTRGELAEVLAHAATPLVIMQSGWNTVLPDLCGVAGVGWVRVVEQPVAHVGAGRQAFLARFDDAEAVARGLTAAAELMTS